MTLSFEKILNYNCVRQLLASTRFCRTPVVCTRRWLQVPKRFYKNVTIVQLNGYYEINLDRRKLKTPLGKVFQVPNEPLAVAVATEWDAQEKYINLQNMHLTGLSNTALDNPLKKTKNSIVDTVVGYLESDTVCYRQDEPVELAELQRQEWDPVLEWFCKRYDVTVNPTSGISGLIVSSKSRDVLARHLLSYNFWSLTGILFAVEALKSVILTLVTVDRLLSTDKAVTLSQLELEFQISRWGDVEWAHDLDRADLKARVSAAILFTQLNCQSSVLMQKGVHP